MATAANESNMRVDVRPLHVARWGSTVVALAPVSHYELHYARLLGVGRSFVFPCDASGNVELDSLTTRARENYLFARSMVGVEMSLPTVRAAPVHRAG
jgi:hypothetical protein